MGTRAAAIVTSVVLALAGAACTGHGRSTVQGITQYQVCGGARPPDGVDPCQVPVPIAGTVVVRRADAEVARVRSDAAGRFRVTLPAGSYTAELALDPGGPFVDCPGVEVVVPTPAPVTLTCRLLAP